MGERGPLPPGEEGAAPATRRGERIRRAVLAGLGTGAMALTAGSALLIVAGAAFIGWSPLGAGVETTSALVGAAAPDFVLPVVHGGEPGNRLRLSELRGRVILLDFWASWCRPCRDQAKVLTELASARADVVIIGVATAEPWDAAAQGAAALALPYPSVYDEAGDATLAFEATTLPTLVVIDRGGRITAVRHGVQTRAELEELVGRIP